MAYCGRCEEDVPVISIGVEGEQSGKAAAYIGLALLAGLFILCYGLAVTKVSADKSIAASLEKIVGMMEQGR